ncbi:hypothetical protein B0H13DRAFT_2347005 [Mycena leptocephala]|nr:hypothetical protein B0H13DRAFT_2347005 [Mycena leptocephala]
MAPIIVAAVCFLAAFQVMAAPLQRRALACSATASTIGGDILSARSNLAEISPVVGLVDAAPLLSAEQSLLSAQKVADQISTAVLFGASASQPAANASALVLASLQDAMTNVGQIKINVDTANSTQRLATATKFIAKSISDAQNLNCTTA